ncbi:hypothetical protein PybrP1_007844 [[Pythium] brassicae (nom. inval.)]|nr:hypothetical protein PybrP1_007844 [[Pythium] brassicae (nom. inval.)]
MLARSSRELARSAASAAAACRVPTTASASGDALATQSRFCALEAGFSSLSSVPSSAAASASPFAVSASAADLAFASSLAAQLQEQRQRRHKAQQLLLGLHVHAAPQQLSHRRSPFAKPRGQPFQPQRGAKKAAAATTKSSSLGHQSASGSAHTKTAQRTSEEPTECELPMDMECGCKTKREKEAKDAEVLARARVQVVRSGGPASAAFAAAAPEVTPEAAVVVTNSVPVHSHALGAPIAYESSFHRRHLPQDCIAFSSAEGRKLFTQAINSASNYMQIYFPLAEQFITQAEPAYCGLATLAMCLNALEIDPGRLWKGPWRWFSEELFDCCTSLSVAKEKGISLSEFVCLARCNGVLTDDVRADARLSLDAFRAVVKRSCATSNEVVVLNYSRKVLGQTGDGHFSPIGGYHEASDMVLLLDVARFKYPPHWVRLPLVFEAMQKVDESIGLPRGFVVLKENAHATGPTLVKQLVHSATPELPLTPAPKVCCGSAASIESARHVAAFSNQS